MVPITEFTPLISTLGGLLIGSSAVLLMASVGRVAGISGIVAGAMTGRGEERRWRLLFIAGLMLGGGMAAYLSGALNGAAPVATLPVTILAGLIVGFGTRLGSGCTSGHGICGLARFSKRSLLATLTFMISGFVTVFILRHVV